MEKRETDIIRRLGHRVAEISQLPIMAERKRLWKKHNALDGERAMLLVFPEGSWRELVPEDSLECNDEHARYLERELRMMIFQHDNIDDDSVIEDTLTIFKTINGNRSIFLNLDWGLNSRHTYSSASTGAWGFSPVINTHEDIYKIKEPSVRVDERKSDEEYSTACEVLKGVLNVRQKGVTHFSFNIMQVYTGLRGLEQTMWDMVDAPGMLHEAMNIIENGYRRVIEQCMDMKLFSLNNDDSYHGSGGLGYTDELPSQGFNPRLVRPQDMWASAESQELVQVSPEMHEEFAMQYERRLLEPFGLNGYGCCEDLTKKMDYVLSMPKLRRISISPWADVAACSERLGHKYIFSWKPQPSHLVGDIDREMIRRYIHDTVDVVDRRCLEIVLKDTHTCENHPDRFTEWARIARSIIMN